ncbi:MAG: DUF4159 domain-containing protein [Phycisphaerae bacterium]|nr:DUF4159 domain-containing protein [Phycisphaerae bacterium]
MKKIRWAMVAGAFVLLAAMGNVCLAQTQPDFMQSPLDIAIERGVKFLFHQQDNDGAWPNANYRLTDGGLEAVALLAALRSNDNDNPDALQAGLGGLTKRKPRRTFARAMRVQVLVLGIKMARKNFDNGYTAPPGKNKKIPIARYRRLIQKDVEWLIESQTSEGGWGLTGRAGTNYQPTPNTTDTSCCIVALRRAQQLGVHIPDEVWTQAEKFLLAAQNSDGGFGYYPPGAKPVRLRGASHGLTTAQGTVALEILIARHRNTPGRKNPDPAPNTAALKRALAWLEQHAKIKNVPEWYWGDEPLQEYLYALTHACTAAEKLQLDPPVKLESVSKFLRKTQHPNGSWVGNDLTENQTLATAFATLTLCNVRKSATEAPEPSPAPQEPPDIEPDGTVAIPGLKIARLVSSDQAREASPLIATLSKSLKAAYSLKIREVKVSPGQKIPASVPIAWLTCDTYSDLQRIRARSTRNYLSSGGVLLIDTSSGGKKMFQETRRALSRVFDGGVLVKLTGDDALINGGFSGGIGNNISKVMYNRESKPGAGIEKSRQAPVLWGLKFNGRLVAIVSKSSLSGAITEQTKNGYTSQAAQRIVLNTLLYANAIKPKSSESTRWAEPHDTFGK